MPKSYSDQEKEYIIRRLKDEAMNCMSVYGIRRTTVDELVRRVRIPKGTFYLFYDSKEQLLFEALMEFHEKIETQLLQRVERMSGREPEVEAITDLLMDFFRQADEAPVIRLMNSGELEILARKLPQDELPPIFRRMPEWRRLSLPDFSLAWRARRRRLRNSSEMHSGQFLLQ